jgi:hypothetical protein
MKRIFATLIALFAFLPASFSQYNDDIDETMLVKVKPISSEIYVSAMNSLFRLDTLCLDDVLVTHISGNKIKNKYVLRTEIRTYLCKSYLTSNQKQFKLSAETNNGYVLVIGQYGKDADIAVRFFTLYIDVLTGKINVIEIEENK